MFLIHETHTPDVKNDSVLRLSTRWHVSQNLMFLIHEAYTPDTKNESVVGCLIDEMCRE
jgi:hypothetical protein